MTATVTTAGEAELLTRLRRGPRARTGGGILDGAAASELRGRIARACGEAEDLLGIDLRAPVPPDRQRLHDLAAALAQRLQDIGAGDEPVRRHQAALARLRERFDGRFEALGRAQAAAAGLREITAPAVMLAQAPAALCVASNFERAILSLVSGGRMVGEAAHFEHRPAAAEEVLSELRSEPITLEHPLIETELLRRRRATIVVDAHLQPSADRRLAALMGWGSYAAAPLVVGPRVIGVLHADRGPAATVDVLDRDVLWEFATALAHAYESASLVRMLRSEREQMRSFLDWLSARSGELTDAPIRLATVKRPPRPPRTPLAPLQAPASLGLRDDRMVFEGLLTRRELDVLRLLADGKANKAIAEALVISDGTVKFHVNSILRKLHAANRAEAVSRYLRLLGMRGP
jgi:DNA-binding CsgD family transcriptional regulator